MKVPFAIQTTNPFTQKRSALNVFLLAIATLTVSLSAVAQNPKSQDKAESQSPQAAEATPHSNTEKLEFKNNEVIFHSPKGTLNFKKHGEGIRKKKVAIISVDVYKISLYTPEDSLNETNAFKILELPNLSIVMEPLRSFGGDKLKEALLDSYKMNSVDHNQEAHSNFMNLISAAKVNKGEQIIIFGHKTPQAETLYLKRGEQFEAVKGHTGFVNEVFAVWLGKTVDAQLEQVKQSLLGAGK